MYSDLVFDQKKSITPLDAFSPDSWLVKIKLIGTKKVHGNPLPTHQLTGPVGGGGDKDAF